MPYGVVCFLHFYAGSTESSMVMTEFVAGVECNMHLTGKCCITQTATIDDYQG